MNRLNITFFVNVSKHRSFYIQLTFNQNQLYKIIDPIMHSISHVKENKARKQIAYVSSKV